MKKLILLVTISLLLVSFVFAEQFEISKRLASPKAKANRTEAPFFTEDFESTLTWNHYDGGEAPHMWHLQNNNPLVYQTTGYSWFMGDMDLGTNGGYQNDVYLALDTPSILVPATNATLTFKVNYNVESPAGATAPYTGWDGCNVRVSTDNGATWTVLTPTAPAYNSTSLYSFGFIHGEGAGIAGWAGSSNGWVDASFNMAQYAGQNVKIRFAFASDGAYCTADAATMFGMLVDNIVLGDFNHDFNDGNEQNMTYTSMVPLGGDLWHVEEYAQATSPSHVLVCQNEQNTYNTNMLNYIETGLITLPNSTEIRADFMIRGSFTDPNQFPEVDYFGWQISIDGGTSWRAMSNPYADPNGSNYVYSDAPADFASFTESYSTDGYISNFAGQQVKFRWFFQSDADSPNGEGIMIDDFIIYASIFAPSPTNLTAVKNGANIDLAWDLPGGQTGEIAYYNPDFAASNGVGLSSGTFPTTFDCAIKVPAEMAANYAGSQITKIKFFPLLNVPYTVKVWTGGSGATVAASQAAATVTPEQWNEVTLSTPVEIQYGVDYWIGYTVTQQAVSTYPAAMDDIAHVENGDMVNLGSSWQSIFAASEGAIDGNWLLAGVVEAGSKTVVLDSRAVEGFKVYHKEGAAGTYELLTTTGATADTYTHTAPAGNAVHFYNVTTMWDGLESNPSNEASEYMAPAGANELMYDDGTAESGFAHTGFIANHFNLTYTSPTAVINAIKFYIHTKTASNMSLKVWSAGTDNLPGTEIYTQTISPSMVNVGWNYIIIPEANQPSTTSGNVFIGFQESAGSPKIGNDSNTNGHSFKKTSSGAWTAVADANYMIRAYVNGAVEVDPTPVVSAKLSAKNYPNPFNPETNIAFNMPTNGHVSVKIYNAKGQLVKTLFNGMLEKGQKTLTWTGIDNNNTNVGSGVYFYKVETNGQSVMNKMLLMK